MHGLEKIQVEVAAVAALLAVHFWIGPRLASADPLAPITLLAQGQIGRGAEFLVAILGLAAFCAVITISSRPEGALLSVLIGVGGVSFLSPPIRALLWANEQNLSGLYLRMIGEVLLLWAGLVLAIVAIDLVRGLLGLACPALVWKSPMSDISEEDRARVAAGAGDAAVDSITRHVVTFGAISIPGKIWSLISYFGHKGSAQATARGAKAAPGQFMATLASAGLGLVLSVAMLMLLLQRPSIGRGLVDRGQILFALATSFGLGTLIANQVLPTPYSIAGWGLPGPAAIFFYALAALAPAHAPPTGWTNISLAACVLPIDWLAAGAGGAVLGYWISYRLHELRLMEKREKQAGA
jgi:hypothetical protein